MREGQKYIYIWIVIINPSMIDLDHIIVQIIIIYKLPCTCQAECLAVTPADAEGFPITSATLPENVPSGLCCFIGRCSPPPSSASESSSSPPHRPCYLEVGPSVTSAVPLLTVPLLRQLCLALPRVTLIAGQLQKHVADGDAWKLIIRQRSRACVKEKSDDSIIMPYKCFSYL